MTPAAFSAFLFLAALVGALAGFGAGCLAAWAIRHRAEVARREARLNWEGAIAAAEARSRDAARGAEAAFRLRGRSRDA
ncbi:hypothetical protein PVW46_16915 [Mameliella sp. AT18]|uniref:hypothetical protein n=1 Tax=Mameliella sp. AT18 TaxID=3028385 RepID=UPI0008410821|nr:hypothetical protein [Mameliella sp. AT18]MDD9731587.1 hypothetical protein [Mameliella sp. AT18]ODM47229.1 hypothetical protein A9320_23210 [Ruegeria sp. PBVC088]